MALPTQISLGSLSSRFQIPDSHHTSGTLDATLLFLAAGLRSPNSTSFGDDKLQVIMQKSPTDFKNTRSEKAFLCLGSELFSISCPHHPIIECSFFFPFCDKIELSTGERMLARKKKHEGSLTAEKPSNPEDTRSLAAQFSDSPQSGPKLTGVQQRRSQPPPYTSFQTPIFQSVRLPWDTTLTGGGIWFPKPLAMKRVDRPRHNDGAEELE